jgi:hypothetical protein
LCKVIRDATITIGPLHGRTLFFLITLTGEIMSSSNVQIVSALKSGQSLEDALASFGENINSREAAALGKLSPQELQTLIELHDKVQTVSGMRRGGDWSCGVLC